MVFERISRGIELIKLGLGIINDDKFLLAFPIISGSLIVLMFMLMFVPIFVLGMWGIFNPIILVPLIFGIYFMIHFIVIFFNVAIIHCATIRLNGGTPTFGDGINAAKENIKSILAWAVISATVGLILQAISQKAGFAGKIVVWIIGAAWNIATFFVLPVLIYEKPGAWGSMKKSLALFRATWGETLTATAGMGIIFVLLALPAILLLGVGIVLFNFTIFLVCLMLVIIYCMGLAVVATTVDSVLVAALYRYARTGRLDKQIPQWVVRN